ANERQGNDPATTPTTNVSVSRSTHFFDPATGTWTDGPLLGTARQAHSAVLLANGKLLVAGGTGPQTISGSNNLASAEIYDPATNAWTPAGNMKIPRVNFAMVALPGGKVLAVGGSSNNLFQSSTELWDPATNTWAYTNNGTSDTSMSEQKGFPAPFLLSNGMVAVAGGSSPNTSTPTAAVELFDPATQNWTVLATPLSQARSGHFPVALPNGKFALLAGRVLNSFGFLAAVGAPGGAAGAVEIYDTLANGGQGTTVTTANAFFKTEGRVNAAAVMLPGGKVLLAGGSVNSTTGASTSEIYDPANDTLTIGPALTTGQGTSVLGVGLGNGDVMLIGGDKADTITQICRP
ncbi:MAG TPA: kelch repeat-containing protein, partial [Myxococcales bacterium]|nr:kelch repeat-containing protein [Myxococcales bacterium]